MQNEEDLEVRIDRRTNGRRIKYVLFIVSMLLIPAVGVAIRMGLLYGLGYPSAVLDVTDPLVAHGERASGRLAWQVVAGMAVKPHGFNTDANLDVQHFIRQKLLEIRNKSSCGSFGLDSIEIVSDTVDATIEDYNRTVYLYESNNVLCRIRGQSEESLLVSSHYDSVPVSFGVTDDGVSVGSMVSLFQSLVNRHCKQPLSNSIVFNFNNGEEIELLGAQAFLRHPWFSDVKAFVNLEGTGAAGGERSQLFRTNSLAVVSEFMHNAVYPHASVISNNLMRLIPSETDYRPYSVQGRLPGIDIAFYSYRYLYHTSSDDVNHAKPIAAQHMSDNLLQFCLSMVASPKSPLSQLEKVPAFNDDKPNNVLPVPDFLFHDIFGFHGITVTKGLFVSACVLLLVAVMATTIIKLSALYFNFGFRRMIRRAVVPYCDALLLVIFTFLVTMASITTVSLVKHFLNPASTYGQPWMMLAYQIALILSVFTLCQAVWSPIAKALHLRPKTDSAIYQELPVASAMLEHYEDGSEDEITNEDLDELTEEAEQPNDGIRRRHNRLFSNGPSLTAWLPFGVLGFWTILLVVNIALASNGIMAGYMAFEWTLFSLITCAATLTIESSLRRWYNSQLMQQILVDEHEVVETLEQSVILKYYESWSWLIQFLLATTVPFIQGLDILHMCMIALPSLVGDGVPGVAIDVSIGFLLVTLLINFLPIVSLFHRKLASLMFASAFVFLWIAAVCMPSFSPDRPQKMMYMELWDISNRTTAMYSTVKVAVFPTMSSVDWKAELEASGRHGNTTFRDLMDDMKCPSEPEKHYSVQDCVAVVNRVPEFESGIPTQDLITMEATVSTTALIRTVEGTITSPPNTRICQLQIQNIDTHQVIDVTIDAHLGVSKWAPIPKYFNLTNPINVFRRSHDYDDKRMRIPFRIQHLDGGDGKVSVTCFFDLETSPTYRLLKKVKPDWMLFAHMRFERKLVTDPYDRAGPIAVRKTFELKQY